MKLTQLIVLTFFLISVSFYGQIDKISTYYSYNKVDEIIKERGCIKPKSTVFVSVKKDSLTTRSDNKSFQAEVIATVIPWFINNISKLFYEPNKYAKNHGAKFNMIINKKDDSEEGVYYLKNILDNKNLSYASYCKNRKDSITNLLINFSLNDIKNENNSFKVLKLDNYIYNYTNVKLKKSHHKVNLLIEVVVKSFNEKGELYEIKLDPIDIKNAIPTGKTSKTINVKNQIFRYIPTKNKIESISFTVNEVNARKKTWDKWLKIFDDNKEKLQEVIIEEINEE